MSNNCLNKVVITQMNNNHLDVVYSRMSSPHHKEYLYKSVFRQIQTNSSDAWTMLKHIFYLPRSTCCGFSSNRTQECCICLPGCPGPDTSAWRRTEQPTTERWALWRGPRGTQQTLIPVLSKDAVKVSLQLQHTNRHKRGQIQLTTAKNYIANEIFFYWGALQVLVSFWTA